jgi:hypothetical protein
LRRVFLFQEVPVAEALGSQRGKDIVTLDFLAWVPRFLALPPAAGGRIRPIADKSAVMLRPPRFPILFGLTVAALALCTPPAPAQSPLSPAALSAYQTKVAHYERARSAYESAASAYWDAVSAKRSLRNEKRRQRLAITADDYILTQPPVYTGPPRPADPLAPTPPPSEQPPIPVLADFLKAAADQFGFVPDLPQSDQDFKRAYARAASAAGLTQDQVVGVYAFETGGNGAYNTQAGVSPTRAAAISPALGYNQLLSTNTVSLLAEFGNRYLAALRMKAVPLRGEARHVMDRKVEALTRMIAYARSVPNRWSEHDKLAKNTLGGWGIHAAVLDIDLGPLLQVQKLASSVQFARMKGYTTPLTAAELELMNLTGDGNGFDMVSMPQDLRERVPTANFFQPQGYERNPVARRTGVVANLFADVESKMAKSSQAPGAKNLASAF